MVPIHRILTGSHVLGGAVVSAGPELAVPALRADALSIGTQDLVTSATISTGGSNEPEAMLCAATMSAAMAIEKTRP